MIDIHTHILPGVDDGAQNLTDAMKMLEQAAVDGIEGIVCTPHILKKSDFEKEAVYMKRLETLEKAGQESGIPIRLYLGSEIYIQPNLSFESQMSTLNNNGKYFLIEFPMGTIPRFAAEMFFALIADNKIPIIAHPERNVGFLRHPEFAFEFVNRGALLQINAGSLRGKLGSEIRHLTHLFMDHNLVHFIASDCHDVERRCCKLKETFQLVADKWGELTAHSIFIENPKIVLEGGELNLPAPNPIVKEPTTWKKAFKKILKYWK
ncbi:hypothetical protein JW964_14100 [candidate division KSB1 bacterium]|nr:hypothetical protein [candidate division KSB1 bacterium]